MKRPGFTEHHLVPKSIRRRQATELMNKNGISRAKAYQILPQNKKTKICRHCHNFIHVAYTEEELAEHGSTLDSLAALYKIANAPVKWNRDEMKRLGWIKPKHKWIAFRRKLCYYVGMLRWFKRLFNRTPRDVSSPDDSSDQRRAKGVYELKRLSDKGYDVQNLNKGYQFRINNRLDVYPTNKRYHDIKTGKRGGYSTIHDFVVKFFNEHKE